MAAVYAVSREIGISAHRTSTTMARLITLRVACVLQRVVVGICRIPIWNNYSSTPHEYVAVDLAARCSVLQRVTACCSVLQRVAACAACYSVLQRVAACCSVLQRVAACYSKHIRNTYFFAYVNSLAQLNILVCVTVCCSVLQQEDLFRCIRY